MKKKKRKNRVILAICSMFIAVMSIFAFIPFNNDKQVVKADTVDVNYSFYGSDLYYVASTYFRYDIENNIYGYNSPCFGNFTFRIFKDNNNLSFNLFGNLYTGTSIADNQYLAEYQTNINVVNTDWQFIYIDAVNLNVNAKLPIEYYVNSMDFIPDIYRVSIYSNTVHHEDTYYRYYTHVRYYDVNDNYIDFAFFFITDPSTTNGQNFVNHFTYDDREYYLYQVDDFSGNAIYDSGYTAGQQYGEGVGYTQGYNVGKNDGYNLGYNTALNNRDIYTFDNLLSAVIDVPVRTFTSLFNFEILGVNLSGFFLGLLTCCIVITIVRLLL